MIKKYNTTFINTRQRGFSMVELMVAMVIGLILMAGIIQVFSGSKQTYRMEEQLSRLQENARYAIEQLSKDIRMSGHQGCANPGTITANILAKGLVINNMVSGVEHASSGGTDSLTLQYAGTSGIPLSVDMANLASVVTVPKSQSANIITNSVVAIADCASIDVFRVTGDPDNADDSDLKDLQHAATADNTGNTVNTLNKDYTTDARLIRFNTIAYTVADSTRTNRRGDRIFSLFRGTDEIVEGVESMQVLYGERLGNTSNANIRYVPASSAPNMDRVVSIQIGLLLSTIESARENDDATTYSLLGENIAPGTAIAAGTYDATDRRIRRRFTTTVKIRNRR